MEMGVMGMRIVGLANHGHGNRGPRGSLFRHPTFTPGAPDQKPRASPERGRRSKQAFRKTRPPPGGLQPERGKPLKEPPPSRVSLSEAWPEFAQKEVGLIMPGRPRNKPSPVKPVKKTVKGHPTRLRLSRRGLDAPSRTSGRLKLTRGLLLTLARSLIIAL